MARYRLNLTVSGLVIYGGYSHEVSVYYLTFYGIGDKGDFLMQISEEHDEYAVAVDEDQLSLFSRLMLPYATRETIVGVKVFNYPGTGGLTMLSLTYDMEQLLQFISYRQN